MATRTSRIADLQTIYDNTLAELKTISSSTTVAGGLPDASGPNAVAHTAYEDKLLRRLKDTREQLATLDSIADTITDGYV